jgi:hypothetical protein
MEELLRRLAADPRYRDMSRASRAQLYGLYRQAVDGDADTVQPYVRAPIHIFC